MRLPCRSAFLLLIAAPAMAQQGAVPAGSVATSAVGQVGQRQQDEAAAGIVPMARLSNRIANRVQSRLRNRIDRSYDPQANATDSFLAADAQSRTTGGR